MSELGKYAVTLARQLKQATAPAAVPPATPATTGEATGLTGEALAQKLASLANGLYLDDFGSESGMGFSPFHAAAKLSQLLPQDQHALLQDRKLLHRNAIRHGVARIDIGLLQQIEEVLILRLRLGQRVREERVLLAGQTAQRLDVVRALLSAPLFDPLILW